MRASTHASTQHDPAAAPQRFAASLPDVFTCPHCGHLATMEIHPLAYPVPPDLWFHTDLVLCRCRSCAQDSVWRKQLDVAQLVGIDPRQGAVTWHRVLP